MLEGILKGILLSKLDDIFLGANQARDQTGCCLMFIDYPESAANAANLYTSRVSTSILKSSRMHYGGNKENDKTKLSYHRDMPCFLEEGKSGDVLGFAYLGPSGELSKQQMLKRKLKMAGDTSFQ